MAFQFVTGTLHNPRVQMLACPALPQVCIQLFLTQKSLLIHIQLKLLCRALYCYSVTSMNNVYSFSVLYALKYSCLFVNKSLLDDMKCTFSAKGLILKLYVVL